MKKQSYLRDLQLPRKVKSMGFITISLLFLLMLLMTVHMYILHGENKIFKAIALCLSTMAFVSWLIFVILVSVHVFRRKI